MRIMIKVIQVRIRREGKSNDNEDELGKELFFTAAS